ncbi:MAG: molybdopterin-guanine dinucleotide biosynthesis protein B [Duodenibacillus sp.]|nr:molybdopterin-guanine dinucleotide biosynthesis protein B [Duodenibacillus sp.]
MFAVGFVGPSGVGKTTLMEKVLARLVSRGRTVSAVKSTHHDTDLDSPGKDSWRYRTAGAKEVVLAGDKRWALMRETEGQKVSLQEILSRMDAVDIVLVEGYKGEEGIPRILVHRKNCAQALRMLPGVAAIATDDPNLEIPEGIARLDINSPGAVANFVVTLKADSDHL